MLAIRRSIGHDLVDVPRIVSFYDRPSCVLLSHQTVDVRRVVHSSESSTGYIFGILRGVLVAKTYVGMVLVSARY